MASTDGLYNRLWRVRTRHTPQLAEDGLAIVGEVDIATAGGLRDRLTAALADGPRRFALDLSGVTFADSQLVHVLLEARAMIPSGRLIVTGCQPQVARLLGVCGLAGLVVPRPEAGARGNPAGDPLATRSSVHSAVRSFAA